MPAAATSISTSPGPGTGTGRVPGTSTSGPPASRASITVMVVGSMEHPLNILSVMPGLDPGIQGNKC